MLSPSTPPLRTLFQAHLDQPEARLTNWQLLVADTLGEVDDGAHVRDGAAAAGQQRCCAMPCNVQGRDVHGRDVHGRGLLMGTPPR